MRSDRGTGAGVGRRRRIERWLVGSIVVVLVGAVVLTLDRREGPPGSQQVDDGPVADVSLPPPPDGTTISPEPPTGRTDGPTDPASEPSRTPPDDVATDQPAAATGAPDDGRGAAPSSSPTVTAAPAASDRMILPGAAEEGTFTDDAPVVDYRFEGTAGLVITIRLDGEDGVDPFLAVLDADGEELAANDDSGGGLAAQISIEFPEDGIYVIRATSSDGQGRGGYVLRTELETDGL